MSFTCPRCEARLPGSASECHGCGMPTALMEPDGAVAPAGEVFEPEVLDSIDDAERARFAPPPAPVGCTLGPGCGCLGLPLVALAGLFVSSLMALLWVLSLGRVPLSLAKLARRARRGGFRG